MQPAPEQKEPKGPLVGTIIVILVIILGGIYVLFLKPAPTGTEPASIFSEDRATEELLEQKDSSNVSDIAEDLADTDLEGLDKELEDIKTELNSPF